MTPAGNLDLVAYLINFSERTNQNSKVKHSGFQHPKILLKLKTIPRYKHESSKSGVNWKKIEKLNPKNDTKSLRKFHERFNWTITLLTENEKQAIKDVLVDYHDIFARHRTDIGMNTEFKVTLSPENNKAVYSQSLPMPIHLTEDLIF